MARSETPELLGMKNDEQLKISHSKWVESTLKARSNTREAKWTESIAVGDREFVMQTQAKLGAKAIGRKAFGENGVFELRESQSPYNSLFDPKKHSLRHENSYYWCDYQ